MSRGDRIWGPQMLGKLRRGTRHAAFADADSLMLEAAIEIERLQKQVQGLLAQVKRLTPQQTSTYMG